MCVCGGGDDLFILLSNKKIFKESLIRKGNNILTFACVWSGTHCATRGKFSKFTCLATRKTCHAQLTDCNQNTVIYSQPSDSICNLLVCFTDFVESFQLKSRTKINKIEKYIYSHINLDR